MRRLRGTSPLEFPHSSSRSGDRSAIRGSPEFGGASGFSQVHLFFSFHVSRLRETGKASVHLGRGERAAVGLSSGHGHFLFSFARTGRVGFCLLGPERERQSALGHVPWAQPFF